MRIIKKFQRMGLFLILVFLNIHLITALGLSPATKTIDFQPNATVELEFDIINSGKGNFDINLGASGNISEIIFFEQDTIQVNSTQFRIPFRAIIRFPPEMEPGIHKGKIIITPALSDTGKRMFMAYVSPQILVSIRVPYPSKYLDVLLRVLEVDEGTPLPVYVVFDNLGSENITNTLAEVDIYSPQQELLKTLKTKEIRLRNNTVRELQAFPSPILKKGTYYAVVNAYYDGFTKIKRTNITICKPILRIKGLLTNKLVQDKINKIIFRVYNEWNTELSVTWFLEIDKRKIEMPIFRLRQGEEKEVTGFFDTSGFPIGGYNMNMTLIYAGQIKTESFPVVINEKVEVEPEKVSKASIIILLSIIAIIAILILVLLFISKKRKAFRERNL